MNEFGTGSTSDFSEAIQIEHEHEHESEEPKESSDEGPEVTASIGVEALDAVCALLIGIPLDQEERDEFGGALYLVLDKYDVPNIPFQEEVNLAMVTGKIVGSRIMAKREALKRGNIKPREERVRKNSPVTETSVPPSTSDAIADMVA